MKKTLLIILLIFIAVTARAQVYDGITQPTAFRYWMPVNVSTHSEVTAAPFIGIKHQSTEWLSFTGVFQYNIQAKHSMPSLWVNLNYEGRAWLLLRNTYNIDTQTFSNTLSGTYRLGQNMLDFTWWNIQSGGNMFTGDRMQVLIGRDFGRVVINGGYALVGTTGFVTNMRLRLTNLSWVQLRYDTGTKVIGISTAIHI